MKKPLLIIFLATILFSSCIKNDKGCTPQDASIEKPAMVAFCTSYGITYTEHNSGILYQITNPGTGIAPTVSSKIYITYSGKLLNGTVFDSQSDPAKTGWVLNSLIDGWKIGIPLIKKGGSIKLVIPSYLAYSCNGSGSIAANSPLYFDVTLVDVQ